MQTVVSMVLIAFAAGRMCYAVAASHATPDGVVVLSDGRRISGRLSLTPGKRLRIWDCGRKRYRDLTLAEISRIEVTAHRRLEREWRFREEGSDEKVFTGRTYPRLDFEMRIHLKDGRTLDAKLAAGTPLYVRCGKTRKRLLLQPHVTGRPGMSANEIVYVREVLLEAGTRTPKDVAPAE